MSPSPLTASLKRVSTSPPLSYSSIVRLSAVPIEASTIPVSIIGGMLREQSQLCNTFHNHDTPHILNQSGTFYKPVAILNIGNRATGLCADRSNKVD